MNTITEDFVHIKGKPKKMVIFLHGYEQDAKLINKLIKPMLDNIDDVVLAIPCAPFECEIIKTKKQWYSMLDFDPDNKRKSAKDFFDVIKVYEKSEKQIKKASKIIMQYIKKMLLEHNLQYEDLYICGFSQGASLSLYTALMLKEKIAGVISFSGILCPANVLAKNYKSTFSALLTQGKNDDVIKIDALDFSKEKLENIGCNVTSYTIDNTKHFITEDALLMAADFINAKK